MTKNIEISRNGDKFLVSWEGENPVMLEDELTGELYNAASASTSAKDIYEICSLVIGLLAEDVYKINFEKLGMVTLMENSAWLDADWEFVQDYRKREKISRQSVYDRIKSGKLDKMKLGKYTLVKEI